MKNLKEFCFCPDLMRGPVSTGPCNGRQIDFSGDRWNQTDTFMHCIVKNDMQEMIRSVLSVDRQSAHVHQEGPVAVQTDDGMPRFAREIDKAICEACPMDPTTRKSWA